MKFRSIVFALMSIVYFNTQAFIFLNNINTIIKPASKCLFKTASSYKKTSTFMLTVSLLYGYQAFKQAAIFQNPIIKKLRNSLAGLRVNIYSIFSKKLSLLDATENNDETLTYYLLQNYSDVNKQNSDGYTALHYAARNDNPDIVEKLIQAGANVNACSLSGSSVLDLAVIHGNKDIIDILLKHKAALKNQNSSLRYAIDKSTKKSSYLKIIESLIDAKKN